MEHPDLAAVYTGTFKHITYQNINSAFLSRIKCRAQVLPDLKLCPFGMFMHSICNRIECFFIVNFCSDSSFAYLWRLKSRNSVYYEH